MVLLLLLLHDGITMSGPAPAGPPLADLPNDTLSPNIIGAAVACWLVAAVFVAIRFYTRTRIIRALNSSDWSILAALVSPPSPLATAHPRLLPQLVSC